MDDLDPDDHDVFAMRVHDAIAANVDLMPGPSRIVERALASAEHVQHRRRRRARLLAVGLTAATAVAGAVAAVASGWRPGS
ncbi:MAG TPA: hypothetical protein VIK61_09695 [Acidimicrobiia bacterium]